MASEQSADEIEHLEDLRQHLDDAIDEWRDAAESGDGKGAAYALGKKSAFITAIEERNGWDKLAATDQSGGDSDA